MAALPSLASIAVASSASSVGWEAGRSVYRSLGRNAGLILAFCLMVAGPGVAAFMLRRGTDRGWIGAFFVLFIPCCILVLLSVWLSSGAIPFLRNFGAGPIGSHSVWIWQGITFVIGWIAAGPVRRRRLHDRAIEAQNNRFLQAIGLRDVGGRERVWIDQDGRELVLHDRRTDALVFRIRNQRGGRSLISLDHEGRMLQYLPG